MANLYITEFDQRGRDALGQDVQAPKVLPLAQQKVTFTTSTQSAALNANTTLVRLHTDSDCSVLFGADPTATTSHMRLIAGQTEYFSIPANSGLKVAAVTN